MEALQRMMRRRLSEHSYKRNAKRLVAEEYVNDDYDDGTQVASLNPAYDIICGDAAWTRNDPEDSSTVDVCSATTSSDIISPTSVHHSETTSTTINNDPRRTDKLLQKVSMAMLKKLTVPKAFVSGQRNAYRVSALDDDSNRGDPKANWKVAQIGAGKQVKVKSTTKMVDLVDVCSIGRRYRNEHRQLLNDDCDDD